MNVRLRTYRDTGTHSGVIGSVPFNADVLIQLLVIYEFFSWTIGETLLAARKIVLTRGTLCNSKG